VFFQWECVSMQADRMKSAHVTRRLTGPSSCAPARHHEDIVALWGWLWLRRITSARMSDAWLREYERKPSST